MPNVSFEYFPPRTEAAKDALKDTVALLSEFNPVFQSVTYGAGGSNRQGTLETLKTIVDCGKVAGHFTYTGSSVSEVERFANDLWQAGVRNLVALRGDEREVGNCALPFENTAEFIKALLSFHPFEIAVGCYPETHPKASSRESDIATLKAKQEAGAMLAITQFFFDNSKFYTFVNEARAAGITIPIVPGILPIYNFKRVVEMAAECGATIPEHVHNAFSEGSVLGSSEIEIASELLKSQVHDLACAGFEAVHIYTLNRAELAHDAASAFIEAQRLRAVA